ncbi:hypothetical protein GCM10027443_04240 [Pontibacter brevis]
MELTNEQWERVKDLVPDQVKRSDGKGRPAREKREVMEGVLWVLRTGAPWKDLPERFPPYQTCHRRFGRAEAGCDAQDSGSIGKGPDGERRCGFERVLY